MGGNCVLEIKQCMCVIDVCRAYVRAVKGRRERKTSHARRPLTTPLSVTSSQPTWGALNQTGDVKADDIANASISVDIPTAYTTSTTNTTTTTTTTAYTTTSITTTKTTAVAVAAKLPSSERQPPPPPTQTLANQRVASERNVQILLHCALVVHQNNVAHLSGGRRFSRSGIRVQ